MKKKIKDLTLEEIIEICSQSSCDFCKLRFGKSPKTTDKICLFKTDCEPYQWDGNRFYAKNFNQEIEVEENEQTKIKSTR